MSEITAAQILSLGQEALEQRAAVRDMPNGERSAQRAADILSAWTGDVWQEEDVWRCLMAVKMARERQGKFHLDDLIDLASYSALLGEARAKNGS